MYLLWTWNNECNHVLFCLHKQVLDLSDVYLTILCFYIFSTTNKAILLGYNIIILLHTPSSLTHHLLYHVGDGKQ
jgi:hypothetical protein